MQISDEYIKEQLRRTAIRAAKKRWGVNPVIQEREKMNSPGVISIVKKIFHGLTVLSVALETLTQLGWISRALPEKYALWLALTASTVSALLHTITTYWPDVAKSDGK